MPESIFFIEDLDPSLRLDKSLIVSLDPSVSYQLEKKKMTYMILEDFFREEEPLRGRDSYFFEQLRWFDVFDKYLQRYVSILRTYQIPLARANYTRLKYCIDTILINDYILHRFFERHSEKRISKILYALRASSREDSFSIYRLLSQNRWITGELLRLHAEKNFIIFSTHLFKEKKTAIPRMSLALNHPALKRIFKTIAHIPKFRKFSRSSKMESWRFFFMHAGGSDVDIPIKDAIHNGATVFLREKDKMIIESCWLRRELELPALNESSFDKIRNECGYAASLLDRDPEIIPLINRRCHVDVSGIVLPFLKHFVGTLIPAILHDAMQMRLFFDRYNINHIFSRGNSDHESQGPLIAAKYMGTAQSICLQHASATTEDWANEVADTETYHATFARDPVSEQILKDSPMPSRAINCKIFRSTHYLNAIKQRSGRWVGEARGKIIYVERKFPDHLRLFDNLIYSNTWYYEFQKKLIDFFESQQQFQFVYKHANSPSQAWTKNSIFHYIKEKRAKNIQIFSNSFVQSLRFAKRVIMDYPSGALFEAAVAGKSVLCFYPAHLRISPKAAEVFGGSLQPFRSEAEALEILLCFFKSNPEKYVVKFPLGKENFLDCFTAAFPSGNIYGDS